MFERAVASARGLHHCRVHAESGKHVSFDSPIYIVFLIGVCLVYWRFGFRPQNLLLLLASYFFYGWWDWRFLALMIGSTTLDFLLARAIDTAQSPRARKRFMLASVVVNLAVLGVFKYFNFFVDTFLHVANAVGLGGLPRIVWSVVLPPAISFYTFQEIAYIVDVYERRVPRARNYVDYALFVSLFPHLIAGPIQKPSHLLPQIQAPRAWNPSKAFDGMLLILEGLVRKSVVADNCALVANAAFNGHLGAPNLPVTLLGVYAFAWQIYGDFSGYSSIARGSAQLLGFHFMVNFRQPYLATSLQDFWRRWHISLSTFLRDYLYIRLLGGNRRGALRTYINLLVTMLLGGLWHGANWTFVAWGGMHGAALASERFCREKGRIAPAGAGRWIRRVIVFQFVCLTWIFFRAPSFSSAASMLAGLGAFHWEHMYGTAALFLAMPVVLLLLVDLALERANAEYLFEHRGYPLRVGLGLVFIVIMTLFAAVSQSAFIYFQF
jgi:alginate O-acetyltransferase complex protein AlgI